MKYKVGDRVRMSGGDLVTIKHFGVNIGENAFTVKENAICYCDMGISHLVISEITDDHIGEFRTEKIAWHFKKKEDFKKVIDILHEKEIKFIASYRGHNLYDEYLDETCIECEEENRLYFGDKGGYDKHGYEIIEIMNPIYVPKIQADFIRYVNEPYITVGGIPYMKIGEKPQYKGIDCEVLFKGYQKMKLLDKRVQEQRIQIANQNRKINADKERIEKMLQDLDKMTFQLSRIAGIVDEDC